MRRIAHIVNPVRASTGSELVIAQPITFASMHRAAAMAEQQVQVELLTAQFPHDHHPPGCIPEGFTTTRDLDRSVLDVGSFREPRQLPILGDILQRGREASDADYLIYTNVDIALMPSFYLAVDRLIDDGYDAMVINRRTIPDTYHSPIDLPMMWAEPGKKHPGQDCFVFAGDALDRYDLGTACIGRAYIGKVMTINLAYHAQHFKMFTDLHLTFHVGETRVWKDPSVADYTAHNMAEFERIRADLRHRFGPLEALLDDASGVPDVLLDRPPTRLERVYRKLGRASRTIRPNR